MNWFLYYLIQQLGLLSLQPMGTGLMVNYEEYKYIPLCSMEHPLFKYGPPKTPQESKICSSLLL